MEEQIITYLTRRPATPENLAHNLEVSIAEVRPLLDEMSRKGWINFGAAWFGNDPSTGITIVFLTPDGRREAERRQALSADSDEPIVISRQELLAELERRFGWKEQQLGAEPTLRGNPFYFWPSIAAWQIHPD